MTELMLSASNSPSSPQDHLAAFVSSLRLLNSDVQVLETTCSPPLAMAHSGALQAYSKVQSASRLRRKRVAFAAALAQSPIEP